MKNLRDTVPETASECLLKANNKDSQRYSKLNDYLT